MVTSKRQTLYTDALNAIPTANNVEDLDSMTAPPVSTSSASQISPLPHFASIR